MINPFLLQGQEISQNLSAFSYVAQYVCLGLVAFAYLFGMKLESRPLQNLDRGRYCDKECRWLGFIDIWFPGYHFSRFSYKFSPNTGRVSRLGGVLSFVGIIVVGVGATVLFLRNYLTPVYSSIVTTQSLPIQPKGMYRITLRIHGGTAHQCMNDTGSQAFVDPAFMQNWAPINAVSPPALGRPMPTYSDQDGACTMVWQCASCTLLSDRAIVSFRAARPMWVSFFAFTIETPALLSVLSGTSKDPTVFSVSGFVFPDRNLGLSATSVFQGPLTTVVNVVLTSFFINYTDGSEALVAFQPSVSSVTLGSIASVVLHTATDTRTNVALDFVIAQNTITVQTDILPFNLFNTMVLVFSLFQLIFYLSSLYMYFRGWQDVYVDPTVKLLFF